jgi:hypothetical protein
MGMSGFDSRLEQDKGMREIASKTTIDFLSLPAERKHI